MSVHTEVKARCGGCGVGGVLLVLLLLLWLVLCSAGRRLLMSGWYIARSSSTEGQRMGKPR